MDLRAEAEKVANHFMMTHDCKCTYCGPKRAKIVNAIVAFAEKHAQRVGARERLEGRREQAALDHGAICEYRAMWVNTSEWVQDRVKELNAELSALEKEAES